MNRPVQNSIKGIYTKPVQPRVLTVAEVIDAKVKIIAEKYRKELMEAMNAKISEIDKTIHVANTVLDETKKTTQEEIEKIGEAANEAIEEIRNIEISLPENGEDGRDGQDAEPIDIDEIVQSVLAQIPIPEFPKIDEDKLLSKFLKQIPDKKGDLKIIQERVEVDPMDVIDEILKLPDGKFKLKTSNIDGLDQTITAFKSQIGKHGYIHGGGDTVVAGTGVTIVSLPNGTKQINSSGSGGSQTPWTSNIDGAGFSLSNVDDITADSFITTGGTSSDFVKGDGSLDSSTYITTSGASSTYVPYTGATADVVLGSHSLQLTDGGATSSRITFSANTAGASGANEPIFHIVDDAGNFADIQPPGGRSARLPNDDIFWPNVSGIIAVVSQIPLAIHSETAYVPTSGSTFGLIITGAISNNFFNPAGTIATMTLNFPAGQDGAVIVLMTSQQIISLTLNPDGTDTILAPVATLGANGFASYTFADTFGYWFRSG